MLQKLLVTSLLTLGSTLTVSGLSFLINAPAHSESNGLMQGSFLLARQELRNTCKNETETYFDPFLKRQVRRTKLVCRPRLVFPRNSRSRPTSVQRSEVRPGGCANILQMAQNNPSRRVRQEAAAIYRKNCS
ncbi:hypothetical protein [Scytonema hofmannii]|nr:hypothetical protein [Scytonema hofmannii]